MNKLQISIYYLQEFNYRLIYTIFGTMFIFITTYTYKQSLIFIFLPQGLSHFVSTGLTEIFFTYLQVCTIFSLSCGIGIAIIQLYLFLRPGLYAFEAKTIFHLLITALIFYVCLYVIIFPIIIKILWELFSTYSQNFTALDLTFEPKLQDYLYHLQQLNKALSFSFPCLIVLNMLQFYTNKQTWVKYRGIAYITAFFIAAFITPPDILSQTLLGLPLILYYELQLKFWSLYEEYKKQLLIRQPIKSHKNSYRDKK
uniref:SecY-independent transporter protein n=1 Tax=Lessonia spicata TaxID=1899210 RepID=A0A516ICK0_9PHAE|nr:SecY-independent transporter protein [Lessonia spicata]QDP13828.1 SecY-independent transporter protein [Lessonia spicata]QWK44637.1 SecY-independent transporter protein [Lessonia spicata]